MNSRLNIALREKRGLVYSVESIMTSYSDAMLWSVYFGCDKTDVNRCRKLVDSQIERFRKYPLTANTLKAAKIQLSGQMVLAAQQKENFAIDMAKQYLHRGTLRDLDKVYEHIKSVSAEDIYEMANTILDKENFFTLIYK